jgi:glutamate/tyrosine decarboxylase-like PLP-dependent enzyme
MANLKATLGRLGDGAAGLLERAALAVPFVRRRLAGQYAQLLAEIEPAVKPYSRERPPLTHLPDVGRSHAAILAEIAALAEREAHAWRDGQASGAVYHGDADHIAFLNQVYALTSQVNPLHADLWPSAARCEAEIVAMTAAMLGGDARGRSPDEEIGGTVTSGGTESILLAVKAYRDQARAQRGVRRPELVVPASAHVAFDKAAQLMQIKLVRVPVGPDFTADVAAMRRAISRNTIALVGSAPGFPHGVVDPIAELAELAQERRVGLHVDACLGGFVLPWARRLGYAIPPFDFGVPGVTSISADTHKYGYAPKGTSVVLYRGRALRHRQYYTVSDWPGGLYFSPTLAGSRPGALSVACWAALVAMGERGYLEATRQILDVAAAIRRGIAGIPGLRVLGDPLWVIAFDAPGLNIYQVLALMSRQGWSLNGLHRPPAIHIAVTLRHTQPGVAERFLADLGAAVAQARASPRERSGMAPVYGLAASLPLRGVVGDLLRHYIDLLYRP